MTNGVSGDGIFPVVLVKINGFKCRALIDSGTGSSYVSAKLIETLKIKPSETKRQRIDMLMKVVLDGKNGVIFNKRPGHPSVILISAPL